MSSSRDRNKSSGRGNATFLRRNLLAWYDRHRRELPWRNTRDPYQIWVSEVMLQQTRVQAVLPYYEKFLWLFPNATALATATEQSLLACWSGLGYYSRVRNMRMAAKKMTSEWSGRFPRNYQKARELPGVGDYTARAVLSIAYGVPLAVVDGNVARVLSRIYLIKEEFRSTRGRRKFVELADGLLARRRAGDFNQAMMELGATVCLPGQPRCPECPVRRVCAAYQQNVVDRYPPPRRVAKPKARRLIAAVICDAAGRCLLVRRPKSARRMGGFWELPMWELNHRGTNRGLGPLDAHQVRKEGIVLEELLGNVRHSITTNQLEISVHAAGLVRGAKIPGSRWVRLQDMDGLAITTVTRKALRCGKQ